jgi:MoxR-like ATPase
LVRKNPKNDAVLKYDVNLAAKTRPNTVKEMQITNKYLNWGAGPRA